MCLFTEKHETWEIRLELYELQEKKTKVGIPEEWQVSAKSWAFL